MDVLFKEIYIFDIETKEAYTTTFEEGVNIVTSSNVNGTDRGKSVLLRSLYHVLGADAYFDKQWNDKNKVYILKFSVKYKTYYIYRHKTIFKIFNADQQIVFQTRSRSELSEYLSKIWSFSIFLPNRKTEKLEIAPPAYTYAIYFIDQDHYEGSKFNSFKSLGQYKDFKPAVIYSHVGIYNKDYFEQVMKKDNLDEDLEKSRENYEKNNSLQEKISQLLENFIVPDNIDELEKELKIKSSKYNDILSSMNECRIKLTKLRNQKYELNIAINQIDRFKENQEKDVETILKYDICPECHTVLKDTIDLRSKRYNSIEDTFSLNDNIYQNIVKVNKKIENLEAEYKNLLITLNKYKENLKFTRKEIQSYSSFIGLNQLYNSLNNEIINELKIQSDLKSEIDNLEEKLGQISEEITKANKCYKDLIDDKVQKFKLNEIDESQYKTVRNNIDASGSNKPISTIIWYFTLNELKEYFNSNSLSLPMVLDSPTNAEMDEEKHNMIIQYVLDSSINFRQLIFSSIGYDPSQFNFDGDPNIIKLENQKYKLLNSKTYENHIDLLRTFSRAQLITE